MKKITFLVLASTILAGKAVAMEQRLQQAVEQGNTDAIETLTSIGTTLEPEIMNDALKKHQAAAYREEIDRRWQEAQNKVIQAAQEAYRSVVDDDEFERQLNDWRVKKRIDAALASGRFKKKYMRTLAKIPSST